MIGIILLILSACSGNSPGSGTGTLTLEPTSTALKEGTFEYRFVCANRLLLPCQDMQQFLDAVKARTGGKVDIRLSSYAELNISGFDSLQLIRDGVVTFGEIHGEFAGGEFPIFEAANLWGAYDTLDQWFQASRAISGEIIPVIEEETGGGEVLAFNYYPSHYFFTKNPLNTLSDFEGIAIRSHSVTLSDLVGALGSEPRTMAFGDVHHGLELGVLDGAVTCGSCGINQEWFEVTTYLTGPLPGTFAETFVTFNANQWKKLPAEFRAIIREEGEKHTARSKAAAMEADAIAEAELQALGMIHSDFSPEVLAAFKEAAATSVIPRWAARAGGPDSEAVMLYNDKVAPITGLYIEADGTVTER